MSESPRRRRRPPSEERWFDGEEETHVPPPPSRSGVSRRSRAKGKGEAASTAPGSAPPQTWAPPSKLTWLLFAVLAAVLAVFAYLRDEPVPWDEDLMPQSLQADEAPSDMTAVRRMKALLSAAGSIRLAELPATPAWQWSTPALSALLEEHGAVLDNFRDLLEEKDQEWQPRSMEWRVDDFGADPAWAGVLALKQVESAYLARRGQEQEAFLAAIDMTVMGGLLEQLDAWPSLMERSLDFHGAGARSLAELLRNTQLDAALLQHLQEVEFEPFSPSLNRMRSAMKGFYAYERKLLVGPAVDEPALPAYYLPVRTGWVFFKPNATLRLFADSFRELKKEPMSGAYARGSRLHSRLEHHLPTRRPLFDPNWSGTEYYQSRIGFYENLPDKVLLAVFQHEAVAAVFAIRRFVITESRVPDSLEELRDGYLKSLGTDPYTGEAIRYNPDTGCLYSVGDDYRDDGGKPGPVAFDDPTEPTVVTGIGVAKAGS